MKDYEVIAHQARRIAELEIKVARALESERQLFEILRSAGIEVTEMELKRDAAEFLRLYRTVTPEGKAMIQAKAEAMANTKENRHGRARRCRADERLADQLAALRRSPITVVLINPTNEAYDRVAPQLVMEDVCCSPTGSWPQGFSLTLLNQLK